MGTSYFILLLGWLIVPFSTFAEISYVDQLKNQIAGLYSSFKGNFTLIYPSGEIISGKIYYQYPNKLRVKLSSGGLIVTDGKFLWMCKPTKHLCFRQDVTGSDLGILSLLDTYEGKKKGKNSYSFTKSDGESNIFFFISTQNQMLKNIKYQSANNNFTINFYNLTIGTSLKSSLFYYKNSNTQIIENPLNN